MWRFHRLGKKTQNAAILLWSQLIDFSAKFYFPIPSFCKLAKKFDWRVRIKNWWRDRSERGRANQNSALTVSLMTSFAKFDQIFGEKIANLNDGPSLTFDSLISAALTLTAWKQKDSNQHLRSEGTGLRHSWLSSCFGCLRSQFKLFKVRWR